MEKTSWFSPSLLFPTIARLELRKVTTTKLRAVFLLVLLIILISFSWRQISMSNAASQQVTCDANSNLIRLSFDLKHQVTGDDRVNLISELELLVSSQPRDYSLLAFVGDKQVAGGDTTYVSHLDCGETETVGFSIPFNTTLRETINVFPRRLPVIPQELLSSSPDNVLSNADVADAARDWSDISSIVFNSRKRFNDKLYQAIDFSYIKSSQRDGYIYLRSPSTPSYISYLDSGTTSVNFNVYFSEFSDDASGIYTVTCLLDDKQQKAFSGLRSWSGPLKNGQAVTIKGQIEVTADGWHQLRCVLLNSLFAQPDQVNNYPHNIRALYIYKY